MSRWSSRSPAAVPPLTATGAALTSALEVGLAQARTPTELIRRWDRQQWAVDAIQLADEADRWRRLPAALRAELRSLLQKFVIGEYTAVDNLPHVMSGAPDESSLLYLATQSADETRHSRFVTRVCTELLDEPGDLRRHLADAWRETTPAMRELTLLEAGIADRVAARPADYEAWLRLVTMFHLLTEGVLAVSGQRQLVQSLDRIGPFPALRSGFAAMMRDEGRHVAFGLHALREGVRAGHAEAIWEVVEQAAPLAVAIDLPDGPDRVGARRRLADGMELLAGLVRRLASLGADDAFTAHLRLRCEQALRARLALDPPAAG